MKRESIEELQARMCAANRLVPQGRIIRHVRTGNEYIVRGHALRVGDLVPLVAYSPVSDTVVVFSRALQDIQAKFVMSTGDVWPVLKGTGQ